MSEPVTRPQRSKQVFFAFALMMFAGAFFGGRAGSTMSMLFGSLSGLIACGAALILPSMERLSYRIMTGLNTVLAFVFLIRLIKTMSFMPAGILLVVCLWMANYAGRELIKFEKSHRP